MSRRSRAREVVLQLLYQDDLNPAPDIEAIDSLDETAHTEFRSDRFVAAVDRSANDSTEFQLAYVVRAVSPGSFAHPAAQVEDMYRPEYRARTGAGHVKIIGPLR